MPHPFWKRLLAASTALLILAIVLGRAGAGIWAWVPVGLAVMGIIATMFPVRTDRAGAANSLDLASVALVALYFLGFAGINAGGWWWLATGAAWILALALLLGTLQDASRPGPDDPA
jgi:hypothetical protein